MYCTAKTLSASNSSHSTWNKFVCKTTYIKNTAFLTLLITENVFKQILWHSIFVVCIILHIMYTCYKIEHLYSGTSSWIHTKSLTFHMLYYIKTVLFMICTSTGTCNYTSHSIFCKAVTFQSPLIAPIELIASK